MKVTNLDQAKKIIHKEKPELARVYGVSRVGIFGSFVFGDSNKNSDIDVLVDFKRSVSLFTFLKLERYLSERLGRSVDLVSKMGIKSYLKNDILRSTVYV